MEISAPLVYDWNKRTGAAVAGREGEGDRDPGDKPKSRWQPLKEPGKSQTVDLRASLDFAETKRARSARDVSSVHINSIFDLIHLDIRPA